MAKLSVNPSKIEVVKKTLSVAAPTGGTMGGATKASQGTRGPISDEGTQMKMGGSLNPIVVASVRKPKFSENQLDDVVRVGGGYVSKQSLEDYMPWLEKQLIGTRFEKDLKEVKSLFNSKPLVYSEDIEGKDKYDVQSNIQNVYGGVRGTSYGSDEKNYILDLLQKKGVKLADNLEQARLSSNPSKPRSITLVK
jgi:hypothetical protein